MIEPLSASRRWVATATAAGLAATLLTPGPSTAAPASGPAQTVIVEFDATPTIAAAPARGIVDAQAADRVRVAREAVTNAERGVTAAAERARIKLTHRRSFQVLLPGMAIEVPANQVDALRRLPGVKAVHAITTFQARTVDSVPLVGAPEVWQRKDPAGNPARGGGVTVAVVDTGVDYRHPALGGGFGPGHKVAGGYDFVNDDADPMDDHSHGTHVAGIVAGSGAGGDKAVTGVAPDATLTAYKVLDAGGSGTSEDIIAGIEAAVDPANPYRADVVNMSLGGFGDGTDPVGLAASRAAKSGVVVVAAAGNNGPGERTVGTPAAADGVIAVGASTSGLRIPAVHLAGPRAGERIETYRTPISANPPVTPVTADLVDLGDGTPEDYAKAGDLRGKVVLVAGPPHPAGNSDDAARFAEVERRGALAAIGYTGGATRPTAAGELPATASKKLGAEDDLRLDRLVVLGITDSYQYQQLRTLLTAGPVRVTVSGEDVTDQIASFSSRGPDPRWQLKPEIVAPGVEIRSSVPTDQWPAGVYRFSGTSMAAPHVAGAAALLRQLWPDASANRIGAALIGSAKAVPDAAAGVAGAGRLDLPAALAASVTADPPALSFGLADLSRSPVRVSRTVTLRNDSKQSQRLKLKVVPSTGSPGTVRVEPSQVTVRAGGQATVTLRATTTAPDQGSADVSGWLTVATSQGVADLRVPYLMPVRTPGVHVTPDPSDGRSEAFVYTVEPTAGTPTVTVRGPNGRQRTATVRHDNDLWWRAEVTGDVPGVYTVTTTVPTATGKKLVGRASFQVATEPGRTRWELIGPYSSGGRMSTTPADPNRLAVTLPYVAGVWITTDRARTWRYERITPVAGGHPTVLIDPKRADRMWAAVKAEGDPTYRGKVLRTDDAGKTWRTLPLPDLAFDAFVQAPTGGALAVVAGDTIWTSRDGGDSWTSTAAPWAGAVTAVEFAGADLYVATNDGLWRWAGLTGALQLVRPVDDFASRPTNLAVAGDTVAVALMNDTVLGSTDQGRTWQQLLKPTSLFTLSGAGDNLLADGFRQTFLSRDRGRTWTKITEPLETITNDLAQWPDDNRTLLFGMDNTGVYATTDGVSYKRLGVPGMSADQMLVTDGKLMVGTPTDVYRTALPSGPDKLDWGGSEGEGRVGHSIRGLAAAPDDPRTVWKLYMNGYFGIRLVRSNDAGDTWSQVVQNDLTPSGLLVHPADSRQLFISYRDIAGAGLFVTRDGGTSWKKIDHKAQYTAMAGDPRDPKRVWLGDQNGLWRSDDGGTTRVKMLDGPVTAIHFDGRRMVVGGAKIRVSTDGGRHFATAHQLGTGQHGLPMRVSQVIEVGGVLYAGTTAYSEAGLLKGGRGVLFSVDGGRVWLNMGAGLPDPSVRSLAASPDGRWLFAGTESGGVYRLPIRR
ncbi:S8 family serine peptidase [Micromonospora polyrhachis]|uniref:Subtilisin family serine protease n=1 Tax=Micromonospora polyrhachis TaxID=1282883 RepID=A0A7W7SVL9_9ACTN|nr:S8 family serine peptidase [Micromonospora polyrhachis]MBB4961792.1 subtilisin family serine protease [Micromonospora polyrhachis]